MNGKQILSNLKFNEAYAKFLDDESRFETWEEACENVMSMHKNKFSKLDTWSLIEPYYQEALEAYKKQTVLASQRNLQFREPQILQHNTRMFNCSVSYADRPAFFKEVMYVLLSGAGVGFSVENRFIDRLPTLKGPSKDAIIYEIPDSIEGWSEAIGELMNSYFNGTPKVLFDYSLIRPKGSLISGGFLAPGPEGLKKSIELIESILDKKLFNQDYKLTSLNVHDITCIISDAVLSGGIRRSALISLFDKDDEEMITCKTGDWFITAPWRARANNSVKLLRSEVTREELHRFKDIIKQYGEPGFILVDNIDAMVNP